MFKVGDWVIYEKGKDFETARVEIVGQIPNYIGVSTGENVPIDECKTWQPQEGEWCWFWDKEQSPDCGYLAKFVRYNEEDGYIEASDDSELDYWDYCEPFIGELPSFLKDK